MPKMTSSIQADILAKGRQHASTTCLNQTKRHQRPTAPNSNKACNETTKVLTDFSIDSIIGHHHGQNNRSDMTNSSAKSETRVPANTCCVTGSTKTEGACHPNTTEPGPTLILSKMELDNSTIKKQRPKVFGCAWCPLAFSNNGQLRNHERIHTGERPFSCEYASCRKTFTRNEELTRHKLIHTGIRPHACSHCDKSFGRKDHLKKHERTHQRKKSTRRAHASGTGTVRSRSEMDMFLPMKQEFVRSTDEHAPIPYHLMTIDPAATSRSASFQLPNTNSQANFPADILTSQIASLAAAVAATTTSTSTSYMNTPTINASLSAAQAIMTSAGGTMQQLARGYWQDWFNMIGQQSQKPHSLLNH